MSVDIQKEALFRVASYINGGGSVGIEEVRKRLAVTDDDLAAEIRLHWRHGMLLPNNREILTAIGEYRPERREREVGLNVVADYPEFVARLRECTDEDVLDILARERQAKRTSYANLARMEAVGRGLLEDPLLKGKT